MTLAGQSYGGGQEGEGRFFGGGRVVFLHIPERDVCLLSKEQGKGAGFWAKRGPIWAKRELIWAKAKVF